MAESHPERGAAIITTKTSSNHSSGNSSKQHSRTSSSGSGKALLLSVATLGPSSSAAAPIAVVQQQLEVDAALKASQSCHVTTTTSLCSSGPGSIGSNASFSNGSVASEPTTVSKMSVIESTSSSPSLSSSDVSPRSMGQSDSSQMTDRSSSKHTEATVVVVSTDNNNSKGRQQQQHVSESLQDDLESLREQLVLKDDEIMRLSRIRDDVESELEDLTASLFEEAHKMVRDANVKQASAEKGLVEANMKIEGLETEVSALKTLVLTSTPSQPNRHLHPQIDPKNSRHVRAKSAREGDALTSLPSNVFSRSPKGSPTTVKHASPAGSPVASGTTSLVLVNGTLTQDVPDCGDEDAAFKQIDPVIRKDYLAWKKAPTLDRANPFIQRLYSEDIDLCLAFPNATLGTTVRTAIHDNTLCISPVQDFAQVPRNCSLLEAPVLSKYKLQLGSDNYFISQLSRNRITAVCDTLNYLRYITQGLVKSHVNDVYWEIMTLRRKMAMARLGFEPE